MFGQAEVGLLFPRAIPGTLAANGQSNGQKGFPLVTVGLLTAAELAERSRPVDYFHPTRA